MAGTDLSSVIGLPPRDAVAWFESKGLHVSSSWREIWQEAQAKAFTVAGMTRLDLLQDVREALSTALREGKTERWFAETLLPVLQAKGWTGKRRIIDHVTGEVLERGMKLSSRLALIYHQNIQTAYMAGRYRQMFANVDERPYWQYIAIMDSRTRPSHAALHGKVFRYDDPFWKTHYPPNGWRCRCRVRALSKFRIRQEGLVVESSDGHMIRQEVVFNPKSENPVVREVWGYQEKPGGRVFWTDAGFSYNPGSAAFGLDMELARKLDQVRNLTLYTEVVQAMNNAPARQAAFAQHITEMLTTKQKTGRAIVVGLVQVEVIAAAQAAGLNPARIAIMTDEKVIHMDREVHKKDEKTLNLEQYQSLARNFANPEAVYWDRAHDNALYVFADPDPEWCVIMPLDMPLKDKKAIKRHGRLDGLATVYRWPRVEVTKNIKNKNLTLILEASKDRN